MEINSLHLPKPIKNQFPIQICAQSLMATLTPLSLPLSPHRIFFHFRWIFSISFCVLRCVKTRYEHIDMRALNNKVYDVYLDKWKLLHQI